MSSDSASGQFVEFKLPERLEGSNEESLAQIRQVVEENAKQGKADFIADAENMSSANSSGIGFLIKMLKVAKEHGGDVCIVNLNDKMHRLFRETGLNRAFTLGDDEGPEPEEDLFVDTADLAMDAELEKKGDVAILHVSGVIRTSGDLKKFKRQALLAMEKSTKILLDLEALTYLDSIAVGEIMTLQKLLATSGGGIRICCANDVVTELLRTLSVSKLIPEFATTDEALLNW